MESTSDPSGAGPQPDEPAVEGPRKGCVPPAPLPRTASRAPSGRRGVLVTGHRGYLGAGLVARLAERGHRVTGCDIGLWDAEARRELPSPDEDWQGDFRQLEAGDLRGFDAVVHLAAVPDEDSGELDAALTLAVNRDGAVELARRAREAGVPRFLLASSADLYAPLARDALRESDPLYPASSYGRSKAEAEAGLSALARPDFSPVSLRIPTVFGDAPSLRLDTLPNAALCDALLRGEVHLPRSRSAPGAAIHVRDVARAIALLIEGPRVLTHDLALNLGSPANLFRVEDLAHVLSALVRGLRVRFDRSDAAGLTGTSGGGLSFDRLRSRLPDFASRWTLRAGLEDLRDELERVALEPSDLARGRHVRARGLRSRLARLRTARDDRSLEASVSAPPPP